MTSNPKNCILSGNCHENLRYHFVLSNKTNGKCAYSTGVELALFLSPIPAGLFLADCCLFMVWLQVLWQIGIIGLFWRNQCSFLPNYVVSYPIGQHFSYSQPPLWDCCISGLSCFPSCPHYTVQGFVFYIWCGQVLRFCSVCIKWWFPPSTYAVIHGPVLHLHCKYFGGLVHLAHIVSHFCLPPCHMDLGWISKLPTAEVFHRGCFVSVFVMSVSLHLQWKGHCSFINFFMVHMLNTDPTRSVVN